MEFEIVIKNYRCFSDTNPARINLRPGFTAFVGVNNSGKSTILKFFYEFRSLFIGLSSIEGLPRRMSNLDTILFTPIQREGDFNQIFYNNNNRDLSIEISFLELDPSPDFDGTEIVSPSKIIITIPRNTIEAKIEVFKQNGEKATPNLGRTTGDNRVISLNDSSQMELLSLSKFFLSLSNSMYIGAFRNIIGPETKYFDIGIGKAAVHQWNSIKTGRGKSGHSLAIRLQNDLAKFFGYNHLEINAAQDDEEILQLIADHQSYWLPEIGSGFAQFFLILLSASIIKPDFILIDEPELNLHPSLQLDFLTTLGSYANKGVLFATHNYGLARAGADRIYLIQKSSNGERSVVVQEKIKSLSEFLGELGFSAYYDLGFDRVLLVEGPSELRVVQQLLRLYSKDHKVVLIPLGGGQGIKGTNEVMLQEIKRITPNVSALIDSEKPSAEAPLEKAREQFAQACQKTGVDCRILKWRAMENYFPPEAIQKAYPNENFQALAPYEAKKDSLYGWGKMENWRIAREMKPENLEGTDLGDFLKAL